MIDVALAPKLDHLPAALVSDPGVRAHDPQTLVPAGRLQGLCVGPAAGLGRKWQ